MIASARWVGFRLDLICALTLSATALLAVAAKDMVKPQLLGLALTYIMSLMGVMQWWVKGLHTPHAPHPSWGSCSGG